MSDTFFRAYQAIGTTIPTYFIESTAPDNVDDTAVVPAAVPQDLLKPIKSNLAVQNIAADLLKGTNRNLVVMVHGFNNPEPAVLKMYKSAALAIRDDPALQNRPGLVCIGYRWPSEKMGQPWHGTWDALPTLPTWLLYLGVALVGLSVPLFRWAWNARQEWLDGDHYDWGSLGVHVLTMFGWVVAGLVLTAALLRTIVYFRDTFRATNYGVPDLVQVIRAIDGELVKLRGDQPINDIELSFIGHSMGGFVVTNAIRVLSDVFARQVTALNSFGAGSSVDSKPPPPSPEIGKAFRLMRFVLASPDIPAEALLSSRGNFLDAALSRFDEAYLFCNEGDEVLRQISTLANYFVFPTKSRRHGFRLGNVDVLSRSFGLIDVREDNYLRVLRIGNLTLQDLYDVLEDAKAKRQPTAVGQVPAQAELPKRFTYFDCTDYVDREDAEEPDVAKNRRPLLTFALWRKQNDAAARLRWYSHLHLLFAYVFHHQKPNVHGGYFEGLLSQQLIFRLGCLGYEGAVAAYGGEALLSKECADRQIRALVSPLLRSRRLGVAPPPRVQPTMRPASQAPAPSSAPAAADVEIPNLVGMPIVDARTRVPQLVLLEIAQQSSAVSGIVLSQIPAAGGHVQRGSSIEVTVAK